MRLKSRPGLDLVTHGFFVLTFPYLMALLLVELSWTRLDWLLLGLVFLASVSGQLSILAPIAISRRRSGSGHRSSG